MTDVKFAAYRPFADPYSVENEMIFDEADANKFAASYSLA
jgi:hypothetical protein